MSKRPFKGITGAGNRRQRAERARQRRSDAERRERMKAIDDASPVRVDASDLIVGKAASQELARRIAAGDVRPPR